LVGLFLIVLVGGCGQEILDPIRGRIIDVRFMQQGSPTSINTALAKFFDEVDSQCRSCLEPIKEFVAYSWLAYRVTYYTTTASGEHIPVSGLMVIPTKNVFQHLSVPILSLQHPTQVERQYSPSLLNMDDPLLTVQLALTLASTGYIVLVPDYPGMGVDSSVHPYCHQSLSASVVDLIRAARDSTELKNSRTAWNNQLFLMGYSEGGYATMVAAKELQTRHAREFTVTAVAPLDGPYSLSESMRNLMLTFNPGYVDPYYLPYVIRGYDAAYTGLNNPFRFSTVIRTSVPGFPSYADELYSLLDGNHAAEEVDNFIRTVVPYLGPRSILSDSFIADLENTDSTVCRLLAENDAYCGWVPKMPMKLFHHANDDLVPCDNADQAFAAFQKAGAATVELEKFQEYSPDMGSIHAGAAPVAYSKAFLWLDSFAYPDRHK
jgi:pimeloyl-ACP methyl ester carboxylesterase